MCVKQRIIVFTRNLHDVTFQTLLASHMFILLTSNLPNYRVIISKHYSDLFSAQHVSLKTRKTLFCAQFTSFYVIFVFSCCFTTLYVSFSNKHMGLTLRHLLNLMPKQAKNTSNSVILCHFYVKTEKSSLVSTNKLKNIDFWRVFTQFYPCLLGKKWLFAYINFRHVAKHTCSAP